MGPTVALPLLLALLSPLAVTAADSSYGELKTLHEWERLDFAWASEEARSAAIDSQRYNPDFCVPFDVKAVDGELFVTVPRLRGGVPSTVNHVLTRDDGSAVLSPYPSWELNTPGDDCVGIQNAFAIEIDPLRRMWIVDSGIRDPFSKPNYDCPAKLVVWDMVYGEEVRRVEFPEELVTRNKVMLRGLVVDTTDDDPEEWFAYIGDTMGEQVLVYSWQENAVWNVTHASMKYDLNALAVTVAKDQVSFPTALDSLALSPRGASQHRLFFAPLCSFNFSSIRTALLRNRTLVSLASSAALDAEITTVGTRISQSEGMTVSDTGVMFYSVLNSNAINQWNMSAPFSASDQVYRDDVRLQWTSSFGWDSGSIYIISNRWQKAAMLDIYDLEDPILFRLLRARVDMGSYMGPNKRGPKVDMARGPLQRGQAGAALSAGVGAAPGVTASLAAVLLCAAFAAAAV